METFKLLSLCVAFLACELAASSKIANQEQSSPKVRRHFGWMEKERLYDYGFIE